MRWTFADGRLKPDRVMHKQSSTSLSLADKECFSLILSQTPDPRTRTLKASELKLAGPPEPSGWSRTRIACGWVIVSAAGGCRCV